jgi:hypothetical protein
MVYNDNYQYTMNLKGLLFKRKDKDTIWKQVCCKKGCMYYSNKDGLCVRHYKIENNINDSINNESIQKTLTQKIIENTTTTDKLLKYQEDYNNFSYLINNDLIQIKKLNNEINKFTTNNVEKLLYLHNKKYIQKKTTINNPKKIIKKEPIEKKIEESNNKIINRCESNICSVLLYENRPEGIYNSYENKYLCNLCKII